MTDVNHQVRKALVIRHGAETLFVLKDLTGIRGATDPRPCRGLFINCGRWSNVKPPCSTGVRWPWIPALPRKHGRSADTSREGIVIGGDTDLTVNNAVVGRMTIRLSHEPAPSGIEYRVTGSTEANPPS